MYYYIFQPARERKIKYLYEKIRLKIGLSGISGEIVQSTPLRTVEELTELGMTKGYSTIVAVGADSFINKVAHFLINLSLAQNKEKIILGVLPLDCSSSKIAAMLKLKNIDEAIENLRERHLEYYDAAFIEPNKFFILPIDISKNKPFYTVVSAQKFLAKSLVNKIQVTPSLDCLVQDISGSDNFLARAWKYLIKPPGGSVYTSRFRSKSFAIESNELIPVSIGNEIMAKTPIKVHSIPHLLQIITPRVMLYENR